MGYIDRNKRVIERCKSVVLQRTKYYLRPILTLLDKIGKGNNKQETRDNTKITVVFADIVQASLPCVYELLKFP